ncbi:hypothetical protein QAD02_000642 [Eretmocerus hayati]|uniref:Uncharacterized protein n=1 Tax=Eretmocerus hayati TaxID=131215 RepID=A0ACC2NE10_9HYME|nr:hypothetical protein QAD02_000642 [Eretmocerus hayati]
MLKISKIIALRRFHSRRGFANNVTSTAGSSNKVESERMKKFHEKLLKSEKSRTGLSARFSSQQDLVLVDTNPENGELIANSEKEPTKWGDWQHKGRVTDF